MNSSLTVYEPQQPQQVEVVASFTTLVLLGLLSELSAIVSGIANFGDAIVFMLMVRCWQHVHADSLHFTGIPPEENFRFLILLMSARAIFMTCFFVYLVRRDMRFDLIKFMAPSCVLGTVGGAYLLDAFGTAPQLQVGIGITLCICASACLALKVQRMWFATRSSAETSTSEQQQEGDNSNNNDGKGGMKRSHCRTGSQLDLVSVLPDAEYDKMCFESEEYMGRVKLWFSIASFFAGVLGGVSNIASAPVVLVVITLQFPKLLARGTLPVCFWLIFITRTLYTLVASPQGYYWSAWRETICFVSGGLVGLAVGYEIGKTLKNSKYLLVVTAMLFVGGLTFANANLVLILVVIALFLLWIVFGK